MISQQNHDEELLVPFDIRKIRINLKLSPWIAKLQYFHQRSCTRRCWQHWRRPAPGPSKKKTILDRISIHFTNFIYIISMTCVLDIVPASCHSSDRSAQSAMACLTSLLPLQEVEVVRLFPAVFHLGIAYTADTFCWTSLNSSHCSQHCTLKPR